MLTLGTWAVVPGHRHEDESVLCLDSTQYVVYCLCTHFASFCPVRHHLKTRSSLCGTWSLTFCRSISKARCGVRPHRARIRPTYLKKATKTVDAEGTKTTTTTLFIIAWINVLFIVNKPVVPTTASKQVSRWLSLVAKSNNVRGNSDQPSDGCTLQGNYRSVRNLQPIWVRLRRTHFSTYNIWTLY